MKLDNLVELFSCVPLFHGLSNEQLRRLAFEGEKVIIYPNQRIISKDTIGDSAYLIVSGDALIIEGLGVKDEPEELKPGTFIGEMAMLIASEHGSTIIAKNEVKAIRITYKHMQNMMKTDVSLAEHFADHMRSKFLKFTSQLKKLEKDLFPIEKDDLSLAHNNSQINSTNPHYVQTSQNLQ